MTWKITENGDLEVDGNVIMPAPYTAPLPRSYVAASGALPAAGVKFELPMSRAEAGTRSILELMQALGIPLMQALGIPLTTDTCGYIPSAPRPALPPHDRFRHLDFGGDE